MSLSSTEGRRSESDALRTTGAGSEVRSSSSQLRAPSIITST
eukprot:gene8072-7445_t